MSYGPVPRRPDYRWLRSLGLTVEEAKGWRVVSDGKRLFIVKDGK